MIHIEADSRESSQNLPSPIDIVDAPSSDPGPVRVLVLFDKSHCTIHSSLSHAVTEMPEGLQNPTGNIRAAWIQHRVVIGKRYFGEQLSIDVAIKRRPPAVI